jgi:protease PrsW
MMQLLTNPKTLLYAILGGAIPAVFWLWFWLSEEDEEHREPRGLMLLTFILGSISVLLAVALEKATLPLGLGHSSQVVAWATIEEVIKMLGAGLIIISTNRCSKPIDYPMYFIAAALGFAAIENFLYLLHPLATNGTVVGLLTGNLRYLGSTLLHAIASGMIGSALGLSFFIQEYRALYLTIGLTLAIVLHSIFNFFIMKGEGADLLSVFGFLWVVAIINILIFEKLKRMSREMSPS